MATQITCDMCGRVIKPKLKENYYKISCMIQTGYINSDIKHPTFCKDLCFNCANAVQGFIEVNTPKSLL